MSQRPTANAQHLTAMSRRFSITRSSFCLLWIVIGLMLPLFASAQSTNPPKVIYTYDDAGNRIQRRVILLQEEDEGEPGSGKRDDTTTTAEAPPIPELEEELLEGTITAYPNPTNGQLHVAISALLLEESDATFLLTDMMGKQIRQGSIAQSHTTLDLTGEANGNYILTVRVGQRNEVWQVIKQ